MSEVMEMDLLAAVKASAPTLDWSRASHGDGVSCYLDDGRYFTIEKTRDRQEFKGHLHKLIREVPLRKPEPVYGGGRLETSTTLYASHSHYGEDLGTVIKTCMSDELLPLDLLGIRLWPRSGLFGRGNGYIDDAERLTFTEQHDGQWEWQWISRAAKELNKLLTTGNSVGSRSATLPEAVAAALAAPTLIGALLTVLAEEYSRPAPATRWALAAQIVARDGERLILGPASDLTEFKKEVSDKEKPFYGRMDTDNSFLVGVPDLDAEGQDPEALLQHPDRVRIQRY